MKTKPSLLTFLLTACAVLATPLAQAASYYWDIDDTTAGAGGATPSGNWSTSGSTWSTSSNGTVSVSAYTTTAADDLLFSAGINATGSFTVSLADAQTAASLNFEEGTTTLSGASGSIALAGTGGKITTANGATAVIGAGTDTLLNGSQGLTKIGVGSLTINGTAASTFTGGLNVNGGTLALNYSNLLAPTDLINNGNALALGGGGNLTITSSPTGSTSQTLGNLTVNSGGGSLLVNPNNGTDTAITLGSITATASGGSFVVGRALSSGTGTLAITTTTDKDATGIYGGRVIFANGTANTGYDWATTVDVASPFSFSAYAGYTALDTATVGNVTNTNNSRITAGATLPASSNRTTNSLKFENPAANSTFDILAGNTLTLTSGGLLMTGANTNININNGSITAGDGTAPADLVIHQFNSAQPLSVGLTGGTLGNTPEILSNIVNNNGQPVTLVKNGPGSLRITGTNSFTGGVIVNQGSVDFGNLSLNNNPITFNANAFLYTNGAHTTTGGITLNNGSQVTVCNNNSGLTVNANVVGSGGLSAANGGQGAMTLTLNGTANTFTGPVRFTHSNGTQQCSINVASLPDTDTFGTGNITFGAGTVSSTSQNFSLASTAVAPLTLANRRFEMAGANVNQQINNASGQALTIQPDLLVTGSQAKNLILGGSGAGLSTFAGVIANHSSPTAPGTVPNGERKTANGNTLTLGSVEGISVGATITGSILAVGTTITAINPLTRVVTLSASYAGANNSNFNVGVLFTIPNVINSVSLTKSGTGTWVVSGNNTYSGPTLVSQGVLNIQHANALGATTTGTLVTSGAALQIQGGITVGNEAITLNGTGISTTGAMRNISGDNNYGGLVTLGSLSRIQSDAGTLTLSNTGTITGPNFGLTVGGAGNTTINSIIGTTSGALLKQGGGTLTLSNINTYSGTTTVSGGILAMGANNVIPDASNVSIDDGTFNAATFTDSAGSLDVTNANSTINLGTGAALAFANSSSVDWTGATLNITGTFVSGASLRFGTDAAGLTDNQLLLISAAGFINFDLDVNGYLIATPDGGDMTPPTLTSITDNVSGGPINIGATVTYTVTFSEDIDDASVTAVDFDNDGSAGITVGAISETSPTSGVFTVAVTANSAGTLNLRIPTGAVIEDVALNDLVVPVTDDTIITVRNAYQTWALTNAISSAPGQDKDGDGVNNAIEFLLGGDVSTNDLSKLPEVTTTATDMIFTFERKRSSIDGITGCTIEVGTTLTGWPTTYTVGSNTAGSTAGVVVTENSPAGFDTITLTVPIGSDPKKFARLKANVTE